MDYIDVAERIVEFREKHPDGCLRPADPAIPYRIETIGDQLHIVVVAAAYRTPDDPNPGIGMAFEVYPGRTPYTRGSELQNAETSAWGRAIVAALAGDTKRGIASAEEVRNRRAESEQAAAGPPRQASNGRRTPPTRPAGPPPPGRDVALKAARQSAACDDVQTLQGVRAWASAKGVDAIDIRAAIGPEVAAFGIPPGPVTLGAWLDECARRVAEEGLTVEDQVRVITSDPAVAGAGSPA